jgi:mannose-1-phosphate guanylyltransferase/phosphomannomutase
MVLAAGYGTRLAPLTDTRAKAVVPFLNRPLLDYTLDWLRRCGFGEAVVNLHHLPGSVVGEYRRRDFGIDLHFSVEDEILGTAGGPRKVIDRLGERVLIVNGDVATTLSVGALWEHHRDAGALATMALYSGPGARTYPAIEIDDNGAVRRIPGVGAVPSGGSEGVAAGCFTGIHIVERSVIELAPEGNFCGIVDPLYRRLMDQELPLHALVVPGSWYEIGTPARYVECQLEALRREEFPLAFAGARRIAPAGYVRGLVGFARAGLASPFFLDRGVQVGEGALLEGVVAGERAHVGCGATVRDSVLLERAWVGAGARLERCLVLPDAEVAAGARLVDEVVSVASAHPVR